MSTQMVQREQGAVPMVAETDAAALIQVISRAATDPAVDMDKMERLLQMHERIVARNAEASFNSAMAQMQAELPNISEKGEIKVDNKVRSKYARFEDINEAVKPVLQKYGFAVSFKTDTGDGKVKITGILAHRDGHRETTDMVLPVDASGSKNAVQSVGSSVSYGKRYVMCALLNITTGGEDDDGAKAVQLVGEEQWMNLRALAEEVGADIPKFCKFLGVANLADLPASKYQKAVAALEAKRKQA